MPVPDKRPGYALAGLIVLIFLLLMLITHRYIAEGILLGLRWLS